MADDRQSEGKRTGGAVPPPRIKPPPLPAPSRATRAEASPEKPDRIHPVTWAAIIVGSGTALLLLWAVVFRGGNEPRQSAEKDQPPLAAAESAEPGDDWLNSISTVMEESRPPPPQVVRTKDFRLKAQTTQPVVQQPVEQPENSGVQRLENGGTAKLRKDGFYDVYDAEGNSTGILYQRDAEGFQPHSREVEHDGGLVSFPHNVDDDTIQWYLKKNKSNNGKLKLDNPEGRSRGYDAEDHIEQRRSQPLGEAARKEYAKLLSGEDADGKPVTVTPDQITPEFLKSFVQERKQYAQSADGLAVKEANPFAYERFVQETAAMERDLERGWLANDPTTVATAPAPAAEPKSAPATGNVKILELADLAELVGPSVVQVDVTGPDAAGTGSGFVLDKQGTIITNFHVIEDATAGRIVFSDKTSAPITGYLGVWPDKDIALVRVECPPEKLHPLRLATSVPRQGARVAAFGSPLGLQQSVSEGIVSAVRESKELGVLGSNVNARLIQTTTPISKGNSGGPLVDMKGMVVGVNTWSFRFLGGENVNFAVAAVELPPLLLAKNETPSPLPLAKNETPSPLPLAKNETPSPLPARDPAADDVDRILKRARGHLLDREYDRAIADYTEAIRLDPKNARAYVGRGLANRDIDRAIADYTQAIRLDPKYDAAYQWRGLKYASKDDYDSAIADFTQAIRLDPTNSFNYGERGDAYRYKGDYDSAIADFTEAIRLYPKYTDAYGRRGDVYYRNRDYDSAIADFTEVIRLDPNALAYRWRGSTYYQKSEFDGAIADFTEVIRLDPKDASAYRWRGDAYFAKGNDNSAIGDFTAAIRLDPKDAEAYRGRALVYRFQDDYNSALADYNQVIRLVPNNAEAYLGRGTTYYLKKYKYSDRAIADFNQAIRLNPKFGDAYYWRGRAYQAKFLRAAAERDFAKAKELGYKP